MNLSPILSQYHEFKENALNNRFFKHSDIMSLLEKLPSTFSVGNVGKSVQGREIKAVKWGFGNTRIMLWSQMHGDEATGTMALFDLFNFLQNDNEVVKLLTENCQLYIIPMVNPDGAAVFKRRNAQQIDINRDYIKMVTPEGKILKQSRAQFNPDFGFNLHDQTTLWSISRSKKPATLSFLAPAIDEALTINRTRENAMLVIADMFKDVDPILSKQVGLFDDEYEPRAFGDNFQKAGTSTILIEAGGYADDPEKQRIREYYFCAMLSGLFSIATKSYQSQHLDNYFKIPKNNKRLFHVLIHHIKLEATTVSIGINYEESPSADGLSTEKIYTIEDIGDLSFSDAYEVYKCTNDLFYEAILLGELANFELKIDDEETLVFINGLRKSKL